MLVITSVVALTAIPVLAVGCGSAKKTGTTASNSGTGGPEFGIAYVKILPNKRTLKQGVTTTIRVEPNLAFVVGVKNDGDHAEQHVKVTLLIHQLPASQAITKSAVIPRIFNGQTAKVEFRGPFHIGTMIRAIPIDIHVYPVPGEAGEASASNTLASYTFNVRFSY